MNKLLGVKLLWWGIRAMLLLAILWLLFFLYSLVVEAPAEPNNVGWEISDYQQPITASLWNEYHNNYQSFSSDLVFKELPVSVVANAQADVCLADNLFLSYQATEQRRYNNSYQLSLVRLSDLSLEQAQTVWPQYQTWPLPEEQTWPEPLPSFLASSCQPQLRNLVWARTVNWPDFGPTGLLAVLERDNQLSEPTLAIYLYTPLPSDILLNLIIRHNTTIWTGKDWAECPGKDIECLMDRFRDNPVLLGRVNELANQTLGRIKKIN